MQIDPDSGPGDPSCYLRLVFTGAGNHERHAGGKRIAGIRVNCAQLVGWLDSRGWLRTDVEPDELTVSLWLLISGETFEKLRLRLGWSIDRYEAWLARSLRELLFRAKTP